MHSQSQCMKGRTKKGERLARSGKPARQPDARLARQRVQLSEQGGRCKEPRQGSGSPSQTLGWADCDRTTKGCAFGNSSMPSGQSMGSGVDDSTSAGEEDEDAPGSGASLVRSSWVGCITPSLSRVTTRVDGVASDETAEVSPAKAGPLATSKDRRDQSANNRPNIVS